MRQMVYEIWLGSVIMDDSRLQHLFLAVFDVAILGLTC